MGDRAHFFLSTPSGWLVATNEILEQLLEREVSQAGFRLYSWSLRPGRQRRTLQVFLYAEQGVGLDDCAAVSRRLGAAIEQDDAVQGSYVLEVSSPGMDRPLLRPWHYEAAAGRRARVVQALPEGGSRVLQGTVSGLDDGALLLETDAGVQRVPLAEIAKARLLAPYEAS